MAKRPVIETHIHAIISETPRVSTFRLGLPKDSAFTFRAGQFIMASIPDFLNEKGRPVRRAYSISSSPLDLEKGYLELSITRVGEGGYFSNRIHAARNGDTVLVEGPYGTSFTLEEANPAPHLFIGAGSGIAPLRAMIRTLLGTQSPPEIKVVYGFRKGEDFIFERELVGYAKSVPGFSLIVIHSRPESGWEGLSGRVPDVLPDLFPKYDGQVVYICGHPDMVAGTVDYLQLAGFPEAAVRKEQW